MVTAEVKEIDNPFVVSDEGFTFGKSIFVIVVCGKNLSRIFGCAREAREFLYDYMMGPAQ
jgi:hypothetical protein